MSRIGERTRQLLSTLNRLSTASSLVTCHSSLLTELPFVLRDVEVAFRFGDQPVVVDLPKFVAADSNFFPVPPGTVFVPVNVQWNAVAFG